VDMAGHVFPLSIWQGQAVRDQNTWQVAVWMVLGCLP